LATVRVCGNLKFIMFLNAPLLFEALPMERVWGGRRLETLLGKKLPHGAVIGETWELVDRPEAQSVVHEGPLRGITLHELWTEHRLEVFGPRHAGNASTRFPLLFKLLDARERLSVQVHPPEEIARVTSAESKTECWQFLHASEGACVYAGLKHGVTREAFEKALADGTVEETLHRIPVQTGESLYLPSGRLHAIGEGLVIVEVQQNSDTTYRVFDWNRTGLDGKPRDLHVSQSLASIDFGDFEPPVTSATDPIVADCPHFHVRRMQLSSPSDLARESDFSVITCLSGRVECEGIVLGPGVFALVPASMKKALFVPMESGTTLLISTLPVAVES
jgi:mannose-6-phosphate isomerase